MGKDGFYYLHTNGNLIYKPQVVDADPEYFNSPFVVQVWQVDLKSRANAWAIVLEALSLGANVERISELVEHWKLTPDDFPNLLHRFPKPSKPMRDGFYRLAREVWLIDPDEYLSHVGKTPKGQKPDVSQFMPVVEPSRIIRPTAKETKKALEKPE